MVFRQIFLSFLFIFSVSDLEAQSFDILSAGELDLDSDQITNEGKVNKYFGMNVSGLGESILQVRIGNTSAQDPYEFKLSQTQLYSYIFDNDPAEEFSVAFRRGLFGAVNVDVLDLNGILQDTVAIQLDIKRSARSCKEHPSSKIKTCKRIDLAKATNSQKRLAAKRFVNSIRGPIVLEP